MQNTWPECSTAPLNFTTMSNCLLQISADQGGIPISLRGSIAVEVELQTVDFDLHSGGRPCGLHACHLLLACIDPHAASED